jgi:hypothetical protein
MRRLFAGLMFVLVAWPGSGQAASPEDQAALTSTWRGTWTASGFIYEGELHVTVDQINAVDGYIKWVLRQSPRPGEQVKIVEVPNTFAAPIYPRRGCCASMIQGGRRERRIGPRQVPPDLVG